MRVTSPSLSEQLKDIARSIRARSYAGEGKFCPVCQQSSRSFLTMGREHRKDAQCPQCLSVERHRLSLLYLERNSNLFDGAPKQMLHVSPARCLESQLKARLGSGYTTADLFSPRAMVKMDIMDIQYPNQSFDVVFCSHVLEHVDDDMQAMRELRRVLKDDGWAILLVPITCEQTFEDPSIVDPAARLEAFGEVDHVRRYGPDYADRLRAAGFKVTVAEAGDVASTEEIAHMGLTAASGEIYLCTK